MIDRRRFLIAAALSSQWSCRSGARSRGAPLSTASARPSESAGVAGPAQPGPLHPERLARFVDALPLPKLLQAEEQRDDPREPAKKIPYFRVGMSEIYEPVHRDLKPTRLWSYGGTVPGPTIEVQKGQPVLVEWKNELPERHFLPIDHTLCGADASQPEVRTVVHVHGARVPPESDGNPNEWFTKGRSVTNRYPNQQDAALLWYHDHAMGIERLNHYAGMFGLFLIRDEVEAALQLPSGTQEIPLVICDRLFDELGQLSYPTSGVADAPWVSEVYGDTMLVNGKLFPYLDVEPRSYRLRIVNASNARFLYFSFSNGQSFHQIGSDQGLLAAPAQLQRLTLGPAERADLIVDFGPAAGTQLVLHSQTFELLQFRVKSGAAEPARALPNVLRPVPRIPASAATKTRMVTLNEYQDLPVAGKPTCSARPDSKSPRMLMLLNGLRWLEPVTEKPTLGDTEIWSLLNLTEDTHPIHLHLVRFQILDRQQFDVDGYLTHGKLTLLGKQIPPGPDEAGWKDTVRADPGLVTRIIIRFEGFIGRYVWHCHLLEHAANEMMRPFEVLAPNHAR
ncbi:MAG TPA: multicopper oxidase [Polyangiaceae bacterium]|nr:multicopper oxidase [Polyangiaceae bacterium]